MDLSYLKNENKIKFSKTERTITSGNFTFTYGNVSDKIYSIIEDFKFHWTRDGYFHIDGQLLQLEYIKLAETIHGINDLQKVSKEKFDKYRIRKERKKIIPKGTERRTFFNLIILGETEEDEYFMEEGYFFLNETIPINIKIYKPIFIHTEEDENEH